MRAALLLFLSLASVTHAHAGQGITLVPPTGDPRDPAHVYLPDQYSPARPWPMILLLHGYLGSGSLIDAYLGYSAEATRRGFILVVPNGRKNRNGYRYWNATAACCDFDHAGNDDVAYLQATVAQVRSRLNVDPARITVAGHSNGAFMAHRLACEPNSPFSAIVSFAGAGPLDPRDCRATHPVRLLEIHALDDDTIKYDGDPRGYTGLQPYPGVRGTVGPWVSRNGCRPEPVEAGKLSLTVLIPREDTVIRHWPGCVPGGDVQLWTIRAYPSAFHTPHTPALQREFTEATLRFLLGG